MMKDWINRTFRKYPIAEYCLDCGYFISIATTHIKKGHIVLRRIDR